MELDLKNRGPVECSSVTAEISPHHRPIDWDFLGRMTGTPAAQKLVKAQQKLVDEDLQRPLRIRGHLFFDASQIVQGERANLWKPSASIRLGNPPRLQHRGVRVQDTGDVSVRSGRCVGAVGRLVVD